MPNQPWDGKTERRGIAQDHDTLVQIIEILKNQVENFDRHREDFKEHEKEDNTNFKFLRDQIGKHAMYIYIGIGILTTLQFILKH